MLLRQACLVTQLSMVRRGPGTVLTVNSAIVWGPAGQREESSWDSVQSLLTLAL